VARSGRNCVVEGLPPRLDERRLGQLVIALISFSANCTGVAEEEQKSLFDNERLCSTSLSAIPDDEVDPSQGHKFMCIDAAFLMR